jgi:hypothetical protein
MASGGFFKKLRILFLLFVLVLVGGDYLLTKYRSTDWDMPLRMVIYPIDGDRRDASAEYVNQLTEQAFEPIEQYMASEAAEYDLPLKEPVIATLGPVIKELPPAPPRDRQVLKVMWWSLKMRFWVLGVDSYEGPPPDIRMFVVYHDPEIHDRLEHSLGLEKGLIGVVHAFADKKQEDRNNIVITHELLHTVGATDKYDLSSGEPLYPVGFVDPDKEPLYPQDFAEIMAGVVPVSKTEWEMPDLLNDTIIGYRTAQEINWVQEQ